MIFYACLGRCLWKNVSWIWLKWVVWLSFVHLFRTSYASKSQMNLHHADRHHRDYASPRHPLCNSSKFKKKNPHWHCNIFRVPLPSFHHLSADGHCLSMVCLFCFFFFMTDFLHVLLRWHANCVILPPPLAFLNSKVYYFWSIFFICDGYDSTTPAPPPINYI